MVGGRAAEEVKLPERERLRNGKTDDSKALPHQRKRNPPGFVACFRFT